jgi:hypothetical protein
MLCNLHHVPSASNAQQPAPPAQQQQQAQASRAETPALAQPAPQPFANPAVTNSFLDRVLPNMASQVDTHAQWFQRNYGMSSSAAPPSKGLEDTLNVPLPAMPSNQVCLLLVRISAICML